MFPFTHIWFSRNVLRYTNNMTVLGSIFPDAFVSKELPYDVTHNIGWDLYDYCYEKDFNLVDFAISAATHTVSPKGLDYYGDNAYEGADGYCFQKAVSIVEEVIEACNIPVEFGLWKAHNFIEMAVEFEILNNNKDLVNLLDEALKDEQTMHEIESSLEEYYRLESGTFRNYFKRFQHFVYKENISSHILSINYDYHMKVRHGINIDIDKASKIIDKAKHIISDDYKRFFAVTEKRVRDMIDDRLESK